MSESQFQALVTEIRSLDWKFESLRSEMNSRFDSVENRLERIEKDLDQIETWCGYRADPNLPLLKS